MECWVLRLLTELWERGQKPWKLMKTRMTTLTGIKQNFCFHFRKPADPDSKVQIVKRSIAATSDSSNIFVSLGFSISLKQPLLIWNPHGQDGVPPSRLSNKSLGCIYFHIVYWLKSLGKESAARIARDWKLMHQRTRCFGLLSKGQRQTNASAELCAI